jgi:hypothetical protein
MDVSVVDGFNNKIEIDATEHGKMPVKLDTVLVIKLFHSQVSLRIVG